MVIQSEFITIRHILVRVHSFHLRVTSFRPHDLLILWLISAGSHIALCIGAVSSSSASATRT